MSIVEKIRSFNLPAKKYVVIGSAVMEAKGIRKANDLDIMVAPEVFEELKKEGSWHYEQKAGQKGNKIDILEKDGCQLYYHIYEEHGLDWFLAQQDRNELIDGIYFASLATLMFKKEEWRRDKDIADFRLIEEYLRNQKDGEATLRSFESMKRRTT